MLAKVDIFVPTQRKKQRTTCGGLLTITVFPLTLLLLAFFYLGTWYTQDQGARTDTQMKAVLPPWGLMLNGSDPVHDQQALLCIAKSGCWYTAFAEKTCPPSTVLENMRAQGSRLTQLFRCASGQGGCGGVSGEPPQLGDKTCEYAAYGEVLKHACLYASVDPIDTFTITWASEPGDPEKSNFGVALRSDWLSRRGDEEPWADSAETSVLSLKEARALFDAKEWKTNGGGKHYQVTSIHTPLHAGWASLQAVFGYYELMPGPDKTSASLTPNYQHTDGTPDCTNVCVNKDACANEKADRTTAVSVAVTLALRDGASSEQAAVVGSAVESFLEDGYPSSVAQLAGAEVASALRNGEAPAAAKATGAAAAAAAVGSSPSSGSTSDCQPFSSCKQLKLSPSPIQVTEHEYVVSPWAAFFGIMGGYASIAMSGFVALHLIFLVCGKKLNIGCCKPEDPSVTASGNKADVGECSSQDFHPRA